jgi:hypothetical protein
MQQTNKQPDRHCLYVSSPRAALVNVFFRAFAELWIMWWNLACSVHSKTYNTRLVSIIIKVNASFLLCFVQNTKKERKTSTPFRQRTLVDRCVLGEKATMQLHRTLWSLTNLIRRCCPSKKVKKKNCEKFNSWKLFVHKYIKLSARHIEFRFHIFSSLLQHTDTEFEIFDILPFSADLITHFLPFFAAVLSTYM